MSYVAPPRPATGYSEFWKSEERYWDVEESRNWAIVTNRIHEMGKTPDDVKNAVFTVKYFYGGKRYRMITKDSDFKWPPVEQEATFRTPITSAVLLNKDVPVHNVTKKLAKTMGPRKDFHGHDVPVEDLFCFDDYTDICITNIMGITKTIDRKSSCLQIL